MWWWEDKLKRKKKSHFRLPSVAQKRPLLKLLLSKQSGKYIFALSQLSISVCIARTKYSITGFQRNATCSKVTMIGTSESPRKWLFGFEESFYKSRWYLALLACRNWVVNLPRLRRHLQLKFNDIQFTKKKSQNKETNQSDTVGNSCPVLFDSW